MKLLSKLLSYLVTNRRSRPEVFCKKGALKYFAKFTGKHLCQSLFYNKVAGLQALTLTQVFSCEFCEILRTPIFIEYLWWLLLYKPT